MSDKRLFLKVKLKSLAAEARIIRKEELRHRGWKPRVDPPAVTRDELLERTNEKREQLHLHRVNDVRLEARATQLAYGYIRGQDYRDIEKHTRTNVLEEEYLISRVVAMVGKYGTAAPDAQIKDHVTKWLGVE